MTVIEELVAVKSDMEAKAQALASADATIKAGVELIAQANKERDEVKAVLASIEAKHVENLKAVQESFAAEQVKNDQLKAELEAAKKTLANPAFGAAAAKGDNVAVEEGGAAAKSMMTFAEAHAEYKKINDPHARAEFRAKHAVELQLK
jgi:hypothetical protein